MDALLAPDGTAARLEGDRLEVRDHDGRLLFEYDASQRRAVIHLPGADLELRSAKGRFELASRSDLRISSAGVVEIEGAKGSRLGGPDAAVDVKPGRVEVSAPVLESKVAEVRHEGERVEAKATEAQFSWGKAEEIVGRLFTFARDKYERIESLLHTRAGRIRIESQSAYLLQAERANLRAKGDVRIDGETINLG